MSTDLEKECEELVDRWKDREPIPSPVLIDFVKMQILKASTDSDAWVDAKDEWSEAIRKAHPIDSGSHDQYATAMRMVRNRYSKGAIVSLINWLLVRISEFEVTIKLLPTAAMVSETSKKMAVLEQELKDHRVKLAFSARENLFGVKPDGTPSEASIHINRLRGLLLLAQAVLHDMGGIDKLKAEIRAELDRKP